MSGNMYGFESPESLELLKQILENMKKIEIELRKRKNITTNDITDFMNIRLLYKITEDMPLQEIYKLLEEELKEYINLKLAKQYDKMRNVSSYSIFFLINELEKRNCSLIDPIIQFLVTFISKIQKHEFYWYMEENTEYFASYLDIRDNQVYGLISHKEASPYDVFATIWSYFRKKIKQEKKRKRKMPKNG